MARTFSIITTCRGRLDHLKVSLPRMIAQAAREVIVVDYSCPEGTGEFVAANYPAARVVAVPGQEHFSNWRARNAGAAAATGDVLVFVDADTILAEGAIDGLDARFPQRAYGFFLRKVSRAFNRDGPKLALNQLKGFHVVPRQAFRRIGGYDEVLEGYAAGADTDLEERLSMLGLKREALDPSIVESVIEHDIASRTAHHAHPISVSYSAGLFYVAAKRTLLLAQRKLELPLEARRTIYRTALAAARKLGPKCDRAEMKVTFEQQPVLMPRQLGYEKGTLTLSLRVDMAFEGKLDKIPE